LEHQSLLILIILILSFAAYKLSKRISPHVEHTVILVFETENQTRFELAQTLLKNQHFDFQIKITKDRMLTIGSYQIWANKAHAEAIKDALHDLNSIT
jgi:ABC-type iron transport system FetAB permease component